MAKIKLVGYSKDPIEIIELEVNVELEGTVWFRMTDKDGNHYDTDFLKEAKE